MSGFVLFASIVLQEKILNVEKLTTTDGRQVIAKVPGY